MGLAEHEAAKYGQVWGIPDYHAYSHGEAWADSDLFAEVTGCKPGESVIDLGCGTGRGGKLLAEKCGLVPTFLDLVKVGDLAPFIEQPLWRPIPGEWDHGLCCDVLEHLPPEFTMLAVANMLAACRRGVFLSICFQDEAFSEMVGEPLHLTVMPFTWWRDRLRTLGEVVEARDMSPNNRLQVGVFYVAR